MKRAAILFFLLTLPAVLFGEETTRRMIVGTRQPAAQAMQRLRGDDFDPSDRVRYNVRAFKYVNAFAADLDESEIAALKKSPEVLYIEPDLERHAFADTVTAGAQTTPYGVKLVNAPAVWPVSKGRSLDASKPVRVVVIDTGIDYNNPELHNAYKGGTNMVLGNDDPLDDAGHGSHVAGIIAGADDGEGIVGVAPQVELYSIKVLDACGSGSTSNVVAALDWVRDKKRTIGGDWIINLSLGSNSASATERIAFQAAADDGLLIFAASGNDFEGHPTTLAFPAGYPSVNSVGAVDANSTVAYFSQRGSNLTVVAPGGPADPAATNAVDSLILSAYTDGQLSLPDGSKGVARYPSGFKTNEDPLCIPHASVSGPYVFCGTGRPDEFPASVAGKIALVQRGGQDSSGTNLTFKAKMLNAKAAGAIGIIIYNIPGGVMVNPGLLDLTTSDVPGLLPLALVTEADGAKLKATSGNAGIAFNHDSYSSIFQLEQGTSMACPHAVGVAALVWSLAPAAKASDIADAMKATAKDLGDAGVDNTYGNGLVNALDAGKRVNAAAFDPKPATPTGRTPGRRGH